MSDTIVLGKRLKPKDREILIEKFLYGDMSSRDSLILDGVNIVNKLIMSKYSDIDINIREELYSIGYLAVIDTIDNLEKTEYKNYYVSLVKRIGVRINNYIESCCDYNCCRVSDCYQSNLLSDYEDKEFDQFIHNNIYYSNLSFAEQYCIDNYFGFSSNRKNKNKIAASINTDYNTVNKKVRSGLNKIKHKILLEYYYDCPVASFVSAFENEFAECNPSDYHTLLSLLSVDERNLLLSAFPMNSKKSNISIINIKKIENVVIKFRNIINNFYFRRDCLIEKGDIEKHVYSKFPDYSNYEKKYVFDSLEFSERKFLKKYCGLTSCDVGFSYVTYLKLQRILFKFEKCLKKLYSNDSSIFNQKHL